MNDRMRRLCAWALVLALVGPAPARAARPSPQAAQPPLQAAAGQIVGADQAFLLVAEDGEVLAAQHESRPVHPASVSKVAATLALLDALGPDHRFRTRIETAAPLEGGVLRGDLQVRADQDPFLVTEPVLQMAARLRAAGIEQVEGELLVDGGLIFNWKTDASAGLRRALAGEGCAEVLDEVRRHAGESAPEDCEAVAIEVRGKPFPAAGTRPGRVLVIWESPPLLRILKELNGWSNNIFEPLAQYRLPGGTTAAVRAALPAEFAEEVRIDNAAGLGRTNRLSPRAAVAVLAALEEHLAAHDLALRDVLPVAGDDAGTLQDRLAEPELRRAVVAKTGTIPSQQVSALAGVARTERWGRVRFAILNGGIPVPDARARQDQLLRHLFAEGGALALPGASEAVPAWAEGRLR